MLVERLLPASREKLAAITQDEPLLAAATRLRERDCNLVAVCGDDGAMTGVISKTDVVAQVGHCAGASCTMPAASVMTRDVVACRPDDPLKEVWRTMKERSLKNMPVLDNGRRPLGILSARQVMRALMEEVEHEEELLRDYVACVGYR